MCSFHQEQYEYKCINKVTKIDIWSIELGTFKSNCKRVKRNKHKTKEPSSLIDSS